MTDRIRTLTIVLENDIREDEPFLIDLITAINHIRGVLSVTKNKVDSNDWAADQRAKRAIQERLINLLKELR